MASLIHKWDVQDMKIILESLLNNLGVNETICVQNYNNKCFLIEKINKDLYTIDGYQNVNFAQLCKFVFTNKWCDTLTIWIHMSSHYILWPNDNSLYNYESFKQEKRGDNLLISVVDILQHKYQILENGEKHGICEHHFILNKHFEIADKKEEMIYPLYTTYFLFDKLVKKETFQKYIFDKLYDTKHFCADVISIVLMFYL